MKLVEFVHFTQIKQVVQNRLLKEGIYIYFFNLSIIPLIISDKMMKANLKNTNLPI